MTSLQSRALVAISLVLLVAVGVAWALWPERAERADLLEVSPLATSVTATTSANTDKPSTTTGPATTTSIAPPATAPNSVPIPRPVIAPGRLLIPAIGLDVGVVPVGLAGDGQMEIPGASEVGWYRLGPEPGAAGSAVLAAHIDYQGRRGAFFDLRSVPVGAEVVVEGGGESKRFVVATREQLAKADVDLGKYFTRQGSERLTLITCGGAFNPSVNHYQDNLIVTALPV